MLCFKSGVPVFGLAPDVLAALDKIAVIFEDIGKDAIVTSARNGKHTATFSRHYAGLAVDLRRRHLTLQEFEDIRIKLTDSLGRDFTVIPESTHYHIQYKPRYHDQI